MATTQRAPPPPTIDLLLNLIDTRPNSILTSLSAHPHLASASDSHGYSLVHAAVSYAQLSVLRELIQTYKVDVNLLDEDGETPLFAAEKEEVARCLVEELGADWRVKNVEGKTAEEKVAEEEGDAHEVCQYLKGVRAARDDSGNPVRGDGNHGLPPLPSGVKVNMGSMVEEEAGVAPDPEIRRRIEVLSFPNKRFIVFCKPYASAHLEPWPVAVCKGVGRALKLVLFTKRAMLIIYLANRNWQPATTSRPKKARGS